MPRTDKIAIWAPDEANSSEALRAQAQAHRVELTSCERYYDDSWLVEYTGAEDDLRWLLRDIFQTEYTHEDWYLEGDRLRREEV